MLAGAMRQAFPPERIVAMAEALAESATSEQVRLSALQLIAERAHGKVSDKLQLSQGEPEVDPDDDDALLDALSVDELRALRDARAAQDAILSRHQLPPGTDEES